MEGIKGQATLWVLVMTVTLAVAGRAGVPVQAPAELSNTGHRIDRKSVV